jgi:membrane-associated phospholipid phosphatase
MALAISYLIFLLIFHAPTILLVGTFSIIFGVIVLGIVNMFTKASGHLAVLSAFVTFLVLTEGWKFLPTFLLLPVMAWARIKTKNHTLLQTVLGTLVGVLTTIAIYVIVKYIAK